jgi:hypothetical protein
LLKESQPVTRHLLLTIAAMTVALAVPAKASAQAQVKSNHDFGGLVLGMTIKDVIKSLGEPSSTEAFEATTGAKVSVWFYYQSELEGHATLPVPLIFENGRLVAWGRSIYQKKLDTEVAGPFWTRNQDCISGRTALW